MPGATSAASTWSKNLFVAKAFLYQDPYSNACTAAAAMMMLNTIAYRGSGGDGFVWQPNRVKLDPDPANRTDMLSILAFARAHDTLRAASRGSDPHGWRNALNAYGWGEEAMTDPALRVYDDREYRTFNGAVRAAVKSIARRSMPVGILGWAGGHAQVMTGYVVTGADPRVSNDFTVRAVFLSDPLHANGTVNRRISIDGFRSGRLRTRFQAYRETDSPYDDPWTAGTLRSSVAPSRGPSEWYHRWVIIRPIEIGLSGGDPTGEPTPPPDPTPRPDPAGRDAGSRCDGQRRGQGGLRAAGDRPARSDPGARPAQPRPDGDARAARSDRAAGDRATGDRPARRPGRGGVGRSLRPPGPLPDAVSRSARSGLEPRAYRGA